MRYIFGRNDFRDMERSEEICYLMTNGLGGYSCLTGAASAVSTHQGVFVCCERNGAPNDRIGIIHYLDEELQIGNKVIYLGSQRHLFENTPLGYKHIDSFTFRDYPIWKYSCFGVAIEKTIVLGYGKNIVGIRYVLNNHTDDIAKFKVTPQLYYNDRDIKIYYESTGRITEYDNRYCDDLYYPNDDKEGKDDSGVVYSNSCFSVIVRPHKEAVLDIIYSTSEINESFIEIKNGLVNHRRSVIEKSKLADTVACDLALACDQFVCYKVTTNSQTIVAGYPYYRDWGRDTLIAMVGATLVTRQFDKAKDILRSFLVYEKEGLVPNIFPDYSGDETWYNAADASLHLIIDIYEYYRRTSDKDFIDEAYPVLGRIMDKYIEGTLYNIGMDEDGLLHAGTPSDQVTWMDMQIGDILPTPRHGKAVEINGYWYNCLRIMQEFKNISGDGDDPDYKALADKCGESFNEKFWCEETGCLKDVVSNEENCMWANQIRCNQIFVTALPFSIMDREREIKVVNKVYEKLYTSVGLRSLSYDDEQFKAALEGELDERDLASYQGTVWVYPLGAYFRSYLKVNDYSNEAKIYVRNNLDAIAAALREGCIGQLPEVFDGLTPTESKGCFAQAFSTAEILRVYEEIK